MPKNDDEERHVDAGPLQRCPVLDRGDGEHRVDAVLRFGRGRWLAIGRGEAGGRTPFTNLLSRTVVAATSVRSRQCRIPRPVATSALVIRRRRDPCLLGGGISRRCGLTAYRVADRGLTEPPCGVSPAKLVARTAVTEIPEHLLKRSRDRRAALGLGGGTDARRRRRGRARWAAATTTPAATGAPTPTAAAPATPAGRRAAARRPPRRRRSPTRRTSRPPRPAQEDPVLGDAGAGALAAVGVHVRALAHDATRRSRPVRSASAPTCSAELRQLPRRQR